MSSPHRTGSLLDWQWRLYTQNHQNRRNLMLHLLTVPLFQMGTMAVLLAPFSHLFFAVAGVASMSFAMTAQGQGHRLESTPPAPFNGPLDVVARIFAEQWITFPRFVLTGGFERAWRAAGPRPE